MKVWVGGQCWTKLQCFLAGQTSQSTNPGKDLNAIFKDDEVKTDTQGERGSECAVREETLRQEKEVGGRETMHLVSWKGNGAQELDSLSESYEAVKLVKGISVPPSNSGL